MHVKIFVSKDMSGKLSQKVGNPKVLTTCTAVNTCVDVLRCASCAASLLGIDSKSQDICIMYTCKLNNAAHGMGLHFLSDSSSTMYSSLLYMSY